VSGVRVRPARVDEAAVLAEMANDLNDYVGISGRPFTAERVRADGFGEDAAFTPLVAELDGAVAGYAFFTLGYDTDIAARAMWLHDIFVKPSARGRGVGYALMAGVAAETVRLGARVLGWGVHSANAGALEFYRRRRDGRRSEAHGPQRRAAARAGSRRAPGSCWIMSRPAAASSRSRRRR
jgi:GNAT superfamily N-acetyltransferase